MRSRTIKVSAEDAWKQANYILQTSESARQHFRALELTKGRKQAISWIKSLVGYAPPEKKQSIEERIELVKPFLEQGLTLVEVAEKFNVVRGAISNWLIEYGKKYPEQHEQLQAMHKEAQSKRFAKERNQVKQLTKKLPA